MLNSVEVIISMSCGSLAILWAIFNAVILKRTKMPKPHMGHDEETANLMESNEAKIIVISEKIARSANAFIVEEMNVLTPIVLGFALLILLGLDVFWEGKVYFKIYYTYAFLMGCVVSILSAIVALKISISANFRMAIMAQRSLNDAFNVAYKVGSVSGFTTIGLCVLTLLGLFLMYDKVMDMDDSMPHQVTFKPIGCAISAFALGTSIIAFFGRVGGGLYTKATDVGADLIGKVELEGHSELSTQLMMVVDKLGDYIGNIIGMSSDLYDSMTCVLCAVFIIISHDPGLCHKAHLMYPFLIFSVGIVSSFLTSIYATYIHKIEENGNVYLILRVQALINTAMTIAGIVLISWLYLPHKWTTMEGEHHWYVAMVVVIIGSVLGFVVDVSMDFFTQFARQYAKKNELTEALSRTQSNLNMIQFGYFSTLIPICFVALALCLSLVIMGVYGMCLITIGMLATIPTGLTIDGFAPICSNAKDMSGVLDFKTQEEHRLNILNSAGKRFSYTRPGFSISVAFLTSICVYAAFVVRSLKGDVYPIVQLKITNPWIFCSLLVGVLIPYTFSALTTRSISAVVQQLIFQFNQQLKEYRLRPKDFEADYEKCVAATTKTAVGEIILPLMVATLVPMFLGVMIHPILLFGFLPGAILSGFQLAISLANTTGPWDNTKKMINSSVFLDMERKKGFYRRSETKPTTLIGETLGDSLKDSSGSSLNLLVKVLVVVPLVFAGLFAETSVLSGWVNIRYK